MSNNHFYIKKNEIKEQINNENRILNERTNFFLLANTLLGSLISNNKDIKDNIFILIALIMLIINIVWLLLSCQSKRVIIKLIDKLKDRGDELYELIDVQLIKYLKPTELLAIMPLIFVILWLFLIIIRIFD